MRRARLLGAITVTACLALPGAALAQDDPADLPPDDGSNAAVVLPPLPEPLLPGEAALDPVDDSTDPNVQDPAADTAAPVDPATQQVGIAPAFPPEVLPDTLAPPERPRWSDDPGAPRWQQSDRWRDRGIFYRRNVGWFRYHQGHWFRWIIVVVVVPRWEPCAAPTDRPPFTQIPEPPRFDPTPVAANDGPGSGPGTVIGPATDRGLARRAVVRRALLRCTFQYNRRIRTLRHLRRAELISFRRYRVGVAFARRSLIGCRARALRL